jgi:adenylosuccinate synthase
VRVNGLTELAITKLDVLSRLPSLQVCRAYDLDGRRLESWPTDESVLARCRPVYRQVPGWQTDITSVRAFADLPPQAQSYVSLIEEIAGVQASLISVGPGREQTIEC